MKRLITIVGIVTLLMVQGRAFAQLKSQVEEKPRIGESMVRPGGGASIFGLFNSENFLMRHSYSFSYMVLSGRNLGVGVYTNSMIYKISNPLDVRLDVSLMHSPFNSFSKEYQNDLNKLFISRAEVNYRPFESMLIQLQYRQLPFSYYGSYLSPYYYNPIYSGYDFYR
jgi:hypothetical protein